MKLRPYQQDARQAIHAEWDGTEDKGGVNRTLLVQATGTGKTVVFSKVIEDRVKRGDKVLVLAHRGELLDQAADKLEQSTGLKCAVEKAQDTSVGSWFSVVVGSVQTLTRDKRLNQFAPDHFGTIIVDEAHHAISDSYQKVLNHFSQAKVLGVTATPDRGDMKSLGVYFESLAYEYSLPKAIKEGYLSPIKALTIPLTLDLSSVSMQSGDFKPSDVSSALDPYLTQIADAMVEHCKNKKTVVFLPLIATSQKFTHLLQARGFKAAEVNGESPNRTQILEDFDNGRYQILCNSMLLTEGWDCPSVDCIVVLRPTKIRSLYSQMVGRGTRLFEGKEHLLLLDFLWHTSNHDLCHPASLIAENDDVAKKMTEIIEEKTADGEAVDIEEIEGMAKEDVIREREEALAEMLEQQRRKKTKFVDPIQFEMSIQAEDLVDYVPAFGWQMKEPTKTQMETLEGFGILGDGVDSAGKASMLIDRLISRSKLGLSTPRQIRQLERRGFKSVGTWTRDEAGKLISQIASNKWRTPRHINPQTYKPGG
jgi:superfamily II DNA or RNA helicase